MGAMTTGTGQKSRYQPRPQTEEHTMKRAIVLLFVLMFALTGVAFAGADKTATRAEFEEFCEIHEGRWVGDIVWNANWIGYG